MRGGMFVVSLNYALDERVANDVAFIEMNHGDSLHVADDFDGFDQAGAAGVRQIPLSDDAGDDRFGVETQPGEEHFHLFAGGVLRFVEDDEGVVQSATTHERERRYFHDS